MQRVRQGLGFGFRVVTRSRRDVGVVGEGGWLVVEVFLVATVEVRVGFGL